MSIQRPGKLFSSKWAEYGDRFNIEDTGADYQNGRADIEKGFPPQTMISALKGGVPPWGQDHNGILYQITEAIQWMQAGGLPSFNQDFCNKNNGYSKGTIVQGDDPNRPWVLWQCLEDNNRFNPNQNKVNIINPQNGWIRYPVISEREGNTLYYNDDGKMLIASPTVITEVYVSSTEGSDNTGDGTRNKPFFSITKAISVTPDGGGITVYLKSGDIFNLSLNGVPYVEPENEWIGYDIKYFNVGSRYITFQSYGDVFYENAKNELINNGQDSGWANSFIGITRPIIHLLWNTKAVGQKINFVYMYGFTGQYDRYKIVFNGVEFIIPDIDNLNDSSLPMWTTFLNQGGDFVFAGCVFGQLPIGNLHPIIGGGAAAPMRVSFTYSIYFDTSIAEGAFFSWGTGTWDLDITEDRVAGQKLSGFPNFELIESNGIAFLSRNSAFCNSVQIINNPAPSYKNLTTNFQIDMDG